ncbi:FAD-binding oxidoreductase [Microbacterium sp. G2-8]|uniref:FAD-binding oxidoreductase n=1 Tax=Microbacterium sp. G2-8 TaxID=2842454 RepID=UPI001C8AC241|nr:FAD-linked oxidase C-terminal domain-containing protein [Microbacterium sp. G2-8]
MPDRSAAVSLSVIDRLAEALGPRVTVDPVVLDAARRDKSGHVATGRPLAVVHAESIDDVQHVMRIASDTGTPVVTQGAMSGLAGGGTAGEGEIALSLARMTRILEVSVPDQLAVVEPGILNAALNEQLAEHDLWWAPDPASRAISSVGGNIATGAGGLLCAKYGVTRDAVLGLDVVLADGRLIRMGHRSVKGVTGLDVTSLMIGSEGTLGVIVGATLKLRRVTPGDNCTVTALFPTVRAAAVGSAAVTAAGIQPAIMELMDAACLAAAHRLLALGDPVAGAAQLTIQTDGAASAAEADAIAAVLRALGAEVELTRDRARGEELLRIRRAMHPAMEMIGRTLIEDVSVPRSQMAAMFDEIATIEREHGVAIPTVAHAGDGNLHPNFIIEGDGDEVPDRVWAAADDLFRAAVRLGGTLTGEHGVGVLKSRWLADELGDDQWRLQRDIKAAFDPHNLLNPGKVFAPVV